MLEFCGYPSPTGPALAIMPPPIVKPEFFVQGIPASRGIAYGPAFIYLKSDVEVPSYLIAAEKRGEEAIRFEQAILATREQIQGIRNEVEANLGADEARIFDAHLLVLEDQALIAETMRNFEDSGRNVEHCFDRVSQRYIDAFAQIDDEYLRERAGDIRDVAQRVLRNLLGKAGENLSQLVDKRIVVANDISPSDAASIDRSQAMGMVTESGSKTSHAVIVARSMKVPAVVGVRNLLGRLEADDQVLVDGYDGAVIVNPSEATLFRYGQIRQQKNSFEQRLMAQVREPSTTRDGHMIALRANIEKSDEVQLVRDHGGAGVGLYRTEFLYLGAAEVPSEEELYAAYREVAAGFPQEPVVIRTLDVGGDKPMTGVPHLFPPEANPFFGFRAIRFCLAHRDIFKAQLRAILRASDHGPVEILFPMVSGLEELRQAKVVLEECRAELRAAGVLFNESMRVGSMIEVPSAAIVADLLAQECDFFSIGTNDLIQYVLAVDRVNDRIAHLYEPTHPAILRLIKGIVEAAHRAKIKVSVCGEMAGDPVMVPLLLGLGVDELSMTPPLLPAVKYLVRKMKLRDAKKLAEKALSRDSAAGALADCMAFYRDHFVES